LFRLIVDIQYWKIIILEITCLSYYGIIQAPNNIQEMTNLHVNQDSWLCWLRLCMVFLIHSKCQN